MSVTTGQSHVRAFDVQFGVLVSNLDQRLRPLIFDISNPIFSSKYRPILSELPAVSVVPDGEGPTEKPDRQNRG